MKRMNAGPLFALAVVLASSSPYVLVPTMAQGTDQLVMVANKSNAAVSEMSKSTAKKLLLGEMLNWTNGGRVILVLRAVGSGERTTILGKICGMSEAEFTRHNLQAMFMGETVASVQVAASESAIKGIIKSNPGAVGFIHKSEVDDSVKIVWTLQ